MPVLRDEMMKRWKYKELRFASCISRDSALLIHGTELHNTKGRIVDVCNSVLYALKALQCLPGHLLNIFSSACNSRYLLFAPPPVCIQFWICKQRLFPSCTYLLKSPVPPMPWSSPVVVAGLAALLGDKPHAAPAAYWDAAHPGNVTNRSPGRRAPTVNALHACLRLSISHPVPHTLRGRMPLGNFKPIGCAMPRLLQVNEELGICSTNGCSSCVRPLFMMDHAQTAEEVAWMDFMN